jgi:hypothetical protein
MIKLIAFSLITFLLNNFLFAQTAIVGKVSDQYGASIPYASLSFRALHVKKDSLIEKITDENGNFQLTLTEKGTYLVSIRVENVLKTQQKIEINDLKAPLAFIVPKSLLSNLMLDEVTVNKRKPTIQRKIDRIIMNVAQTANASGKSALELFKMAPGVFVNNGQISINGVVGTRILVDGKSINLAGNDLRNYLQTLRSNDIQSIEIIAHPSAEFDAEGSGGIINIVLKKQDKQGLNGYIGNDYAIGLGKYVTYTPYAGLNYQIGKVGLMASYSHSRAKSYEELKQRRDFPNQGLYQQETENTQTNKNDRIRLGATYDFTGKQFLGFSYTGQYSSFLGPSTAHSTITYPDAAKNIRSQGSFPSESKSNYQNLGLNYVLETDSLHSKFSLVIDYTHNQRNGNSISNSVDFDANGNIRSDTLFRLDYPSEAKIFTGDAKYNWITKSGNNLSIGIKATATDIMNTNRYQVFHQAWMPMPALDFQFDYEERIYATYANYTGKWAQIDYQLGLRGEKSNIQGQLLSEQRDKLAQDYFNLFPSIFLKKNLNSQGSNYILLTYNRRIKRPSYFDLNPYKYYIDNYSVQTGNPFLKPQFTNSFEISGLWKEKYYTALNYSHTKNAISQIIRNQAEEELLTIIKDNVGTQGVWTATLSAPISLLPCWSSTNTILFTHTRSTSPYFNLKKASFILQTEQEISFGKGYSINLNAFYTPQMLLGNIVTKAIGSVDLGIQKKLIKDQLVAKANISDIFFTNNYRATSYFNNTKIWIMHREQSRVCSISLLYNFKTGTTFKAKRMESSSMEEKGRL